MGSEAPSGALQRPSALCGAVEWDARVRTPRSGPRPFQGRLAGCEVHFAPASGPLSFRSDLSRTRSGERREPFAQPLDHPGVDLRNT